MKIYYICNNIITCEYYEKTEYEESYRWTYFMYTPILLAGV